MSQEEVEGGFELIVADGMSDDGTRDVLRRLAQVHPSLRVLDNPGRIVSTGLNAAINAASGEIIIRADAHTVYATNYLRECVAVLRESGADNVGGPWMAVGDGYVGDAVAAAFHSRFASGGARAHDVAYEGEVDTVYLGCWPRSVFERLGGFDEELVRNQDDEFNLRLRRAGGAIWQSTRIKSSYRPRNTLRQLFRQYSQYGYWKVRVIQKHRLPASWRHLAPAAFLLTMMVLLCASLFSALALRAAAFVAVGYVLGNLAASGITASRTKVSLLPVLPPVFACFHLGYGYGFLRGVWDFAVMRRAPATKMSTISRRADPAFEPRIHIDEPPGI